MKNSTDHKLMELIAKGSAPAFEELFLRYGAKILGYCTRIVGSPAAGEDLSQEVWMRVTKAAPGYRAEASLASWLMTIARNLSLNYLRSQNRLTELGDDEPEAESSIELDRPSVEQELIAKQDRKRVLKALSELDDLKRSAMMMWLQEELSYEEIAKELRLSQAALKSLLFRARSELGEKLGRK